MLFLYTTGIRIYHALIHLFQPFNKSAKNWVEGRNDLFRKLASFKPAKGKTVWIHCASLGEFEQARPLIERLKKDRDLKIVVTFFSPSGYNIRKNYDKADLVAYLPIDLPEQVKKFFDLVQPDAGVFIKYELWLNFIHEAGTRNIPLFLACGLFREDHFLFKWPGRSLLYVLKAFRHFYVQDKASAKLLAGNGFQNVSVSGDTRYDRVLEIASAMRDIPVAEEFSKHAEVIVAGSTWEPDEQLLAEMMHSLQDKHSHIRLIIAPHHVEEEVISRIEERFPSSFRFSSGFQAGKNVMIIDNIGMLSSLYRYADVAYVGGGFGKAVHNVLEPAAYHIPVVFGPNNKKFREIQQLKQEQLGFEIQNSTELFMIMETLLSDQKRRVAIRDRSREFMKINSGATEEITRDLLKVLSEQP